MNDLNTLLDRAAGPASHLHVDAAADLTRGRRALSRTRRRRGAVGLAGIAAAGVAGVGVVRYASTDVETLQAVERHGEDAGQSGIAFLAQPLEAGPYTFDSTPEGWEVQGVTSSAVTIAPVGAADQNPDSFIGKLVILLDGNPLTGERVEHGGRVFWVHGNSGYTTIATPTLPGEPAGNVLIQFPDDTGWSRDTMLEFLAGVHVGAGAQQGVG
jgi:hypothetical protein